MSLGQQGHLMASCSMDSLSISPRSESEADPDSKQLLEDRSYLGKQSAFRLAVLLAACSVVLIIGFSLRPYGLVRPSLLSLKDISHGCRDFSERREWRTLSVTEKFDYVEAVKCLTEAPAMLSTNGTAYNEFSFVHSRIGGYSHEAAPFLPWHRYFIHIYETALRKKCGYSGSLPYWDWTLDWEDFTNAPVWNAESGFGGDGNKSSEVTVGHGYCITDGPFAMLEAEYYDGEYYPHCLSRNFLQGDLLAKYSGRLQPTVVDELFEEPTYSSFFLAVEEGPHSSIPISVRGDFLKFTAPNDPVFFLHHAQVDRLWWIWQRKNPRSRLLQYNGISRDGSSTPAGLGDRLEMHGLAPDLTVMNVMKADAAPFCYRYA